MTPHQFVGLADAAARKSVHYQTVRRAIARGDLKAIKVGGGVLIATVDLDAWEPQYKHAPLQYRRVLSQSTPPQRQTSGS